MTHRPFSVWAPKARRVDFVAAGGRQPMDAAEGGWWRLRSDPPPGEIDYAFSLDGGEPLPDPRAPRLPQGVGGPARTVDHLAFAWSDARWQPPPLSSAIVYELHVGTFSAAGTFEGAIEHLGALAELGVTHVELMPVNSFPGARGWGYDGVGLFAPHEPYGGPEGLKRFVDAAHARGLAVLLDVVYNHLGPAGNHLARFGPYFTDRHRTPWGDALNLDGPGSDEVRRFLLDNALAWLRDYHVDGLRIDAVHALLDASATHFLAELRDAVDALVAQRGRHAVLVAESDLNDPRVVLPREAGGLGMDAQWSDDFHHALHALLTGERRGYYADFGRIAHLAKAFESVFVYDGGFAPHRGRRHGAPPRGLSAHRFLGYLQTHDQVGNRAFGERSAALLPPARLAMGAALVLLAPFVPMLFQGEEWAASSPFLYFTDHADPELGRAIREGRRREFPELHEGADDVPDPQAKESFERSRLDWSERAREPHAALLDWHRRLIALRRSIPALADGSPGAARVRFDETARWLCVARGPVRIACNLAAAEQWIPLQGEGRGSLQLAWPAPPAFSDGGVRLAPDGVAVVCMDA
ncbi:MAG: malto-oligosyltrehalose trehalohydrolase [Proteobacteria bacterium]|nr:MAG: malto-oligosyltrehalose trehalohydrolase [Pseudomonadota bacterium]